MIPERLVLDAGPLIALLHRSDPDHEEAVRGFRRLAEGGARLFLPMPVLFEVFKWLLFQAGPKAAREGLAKVEEGVVVVPFTLEDLEEVRLLLARLPGWGGTLEDAGVALLALRLGAPVWTLNVSILYEANEVCNRPRRSPGWSRSPRFNPLRG